MHNRFFSSVRRRLSWQAWQLAYVLLSLSWLFGPSLNRHLSTTGTFISQYEDPGQPWSWLYRACDIAAALLLGLAVWVIARRSRGTVLPRFVKASLLLLGIIAAGSFIDDAFPSHCSGGFLCFVPSEISRIVHAGESVATTCALIALNALWAWRKLPWARTVLFVQLLWSGVFIVGQVGSGAGNSLVQFGYQIVVTLWVASLVPILAQARPFPVRDSRLRAVTHVIAAWVFFGGFFAVVNSIRNIREISHLGEVYFGNNTAWLSQHGVAVGIILMYISRHLWRGEYRAWQLTSLLLWLETIKYATITPDGEMVALYGLTAAALFVLRGVFDRVSSVEELQDRLKKLAYVGIAFVAALLAGIVAYRLKHHQDIDTIKINLGQFIRHFFLFDVVNDLGPLSRRLLGQVLNVAGVVLLLAIVVSLFRPRKPLLRPAGEYDRRQVLNMLRHHSNSSEDYFKYWPAKSYWWDAARDAAVAYRVVGNVAFALADPVAAPGTRRRALEQFLRYCRQNGWRACFLMVDNDRQAAYKDAGYKLFRIGASAVVDINEFTSETARNKWWRWVLNKSKKQGWEYGLASPPHSSALLAELRSVSAEWMERQHHVERGFALGYFDESYLQSCRLHLLRESGSLIAFANELPTFNSVPTATIDLMRFLPDRNHAMPALLARTIQQLAEEGTKQKFDLGFVPLASPSARTEQVIQRLGQLLMSETVSSQGLEQFKNKFAPHWQDNYIAFDGDWIDLIHISRQLDSLLEP